MDLIEAYLTANLITAQTDDELAKIEASVERFEKIITHQPMRFIGALHAAVAPDAPASRAILDEAYEVVRSEWRTLASRYPERPTQLLRVIVLGAAVSLGRKNDQWADAFGVLLPALQLFIEQNAADAEIWQALVDEFQGGYERRAEEQWSVPSALDLPDIELSETASAEFSLTGGNISSKILATQLLSAFSPTNVDGEAIENGNQSNPHPQLQAWSEHASNRLGAVLAGPYANAVRGSLNAPDVSALADDITNYVRSAAEQLVVAVKGQDLRTRLLWWKESGYSPGKRATYQSLSTETASIQAAIDLAQWLPQQTPPSAFYFLRNSISNFVEAPDFSLALQKYCDAAEHLDLPNQGSDKGSSADSACLAAVFDVGSTMNWANTIFELTTAMLPGDVAVHLLREALAVRILNDIKPTRKPKS